MGKLYGNPQVSRLLAILFSVGSLSRGMLKILGKYGNFRYFRRGQSGLRSMNDEIWTIRELADYLKLKDKTAYALVAKGEIPGFKVGGSWRFRRSDIDEWISTKAKQTEGKSGHDD